MASVAAGVWAGEIMLDIGEERAGNMRVIIEPPAECKVVQRMTAIDDNPVRIVEVLRQLLRVNQRRVRHVHYRRLMVVLV